jgi:hypothetical protein
MGRNYGTYTQCRYDREVQLRGFEEAEVGLGTEGLDSKVPVAFILALLSFALALTGLAFRPL